MTIKRGILDTSRFLASAGIGRLASKYKKGQVIFAQGEPADAVFYIQTGKIKLTVVIRGGERGGYRGT